MVIIKFYYTLNIYNYYHIKIIIILLINVTIILKLINYLFYKLNQNIL